MAVAIIDEFRTVDPKTHNYNPQQYDLWSNGKYLIAYDFRGGAWHCTCPAFRFHKCGVECTPANEDCSNGCKHLRALHEAFRIRREQIREKTRRASTAAAGGD